MEENVLNTTNTEAQEVVEPKVDEPKAETQMSAEEQLAQMRVEMAKLKRALDKSSSETANYKKQLREKQSADEIALQEKAEKEALREEKYQQLLKENTVNKYAKNFLSLGYSEELAEKAANAQYDNDFETLVEVQKVVMEQKAKAIKADLLKQMPTPPISNDGEVHMTQEQFDKMTYLEQVEFRNKYPQVWEKFI